MAERRSIGEIIDSLNEAAGYEFITSLGRVEKNESTYYIATVTLDGVERGVIVEEGDLESALNRAAYEVEFGTNESVVDRLKSAMEEVGFDRAIEILESLQ